MVPANADATLSKRFVRLTCGSFAEHSQQPRPTNFPAEGIRSSEPVLGSVASERPALAVHYLFMGTQIVWVTLANVCNVCKILDTACLSRQSL